jgi:hypothetical protein
VIWPSSSSTGRPSAPQARSLELVGDLLDRSHGKSRDARPGAIRTEIDRRLTAVQDFHGTEATRIRAILETGDDKAWWQA